MTILPNRVGHFFIDRNIQLLYYVKVMNEDFLILKNRTLQAENIVKTEDGYYRYVNHRDRLVTTGFGILAGLLRNTDIIRFDAATVAIMRGRYTAFYVPD